MAAQVNLMTYLQESLPTIPAKPPTHPGTDTTNDSYGADDIKTITVWQEFSLDRILGRYQNMLMAASLDADPIKSPAGTVNSEEIIRARIFKIVHPRVRRALRAGFTFLTGNNWWTGSPLLILIAVQQQKIIDNFRPDTAFYDSKQFGSGPNCAPGDIKPHWKWNSGRRTGSRSDQREYCQVLSQVNFYMIQRQSRYGFVLTDREMVAIRRLDDNGNLQLSRQIQWDAKGSLEQPRWHLCWHCGISECWLRKTRAMINGWCDNMQSMNRIITLKAIWTGSWLFGVLEEHRMWDGEPLLQGRSWFYKQHSRSQLPCP